MVDSEDGNARLAHRPCDRVIRGRIVEVLYVEIGFSADCVGRVGHRGPGVATIVVEDQIDWQAAGREGETLTNLAAREAGAFEHHARLLGQIGERNSVAPAVRARGQRGQDRRGNGDQ